MASLKLSPTALARLAAYTDDRKRRSPADRELKSAKRQRPRVPDASSLTDIPPELHEFETEAQARAEDRTRVKGLRAARPTPGRTNWTNLGQRARLIERLPFPVRFPPRDAADFDRLIERLSHEGPPPIHHTLASAVSMRAIRQMVIDPMLNAFEAYPDEELATATVINTRWTFTPATLDGVTAKQLKNRFRSELNRIGLTKVPGPFVAFLHGEFEPRSGRYVLHFHILTTREKALLLHKLKELRGYRRTASGAAPVVCKPVRDRFRQFSYLLKSYWPARAIRMVNGVAKRDRKARRIPEPFASQVLIWLDRQRLGDLTVMHDCWSRRNGGTPAMKRLYLSIFGAW